ncbi:hypothetical protein HDV02_004898 [Globomyces sp. JEL0801]|nr:hypothetical protein HDV02_004898 [Globomyces sp. JEL0801]
MFNQESNVDNSNSNNLNLNRRLSLDLLMQNNLLNQNRRASIHTPYQNNYQNNNYILNYQNNLNIQNNNQNINTNSNQNSISNHDYNLDLFSSIVSDSIPDKQSQRAPQKMYALRIATIPGIYLTWTMAKSLIEGCPGAKYKGFFTLEECMAFIRDQFPDSTFSKNDNGDFIMDDPTPVYELIEEARAKKEKTAGLVIHDDVSCFDYHDSQVERLRGLFRNHPYVNVTLNPAQSSALELVKNRQNVYIIGNKTSGKDVLLSHICAYLSTTQSIFHVTSASIIDSLYFNCNSTFGWTGMGKTLGTQKQILMKVRKNTLARKIWADISVLIVRQATMLSAFMMDTMDFLAREIRKVEKPFGGIQLIFMSEPYGLTPRPLPVVSCPLCGQAHRLATLQTNTVGGLITCTNETCRQGFINSMLLLSYEASCWDHIHFYPIQLPKVYEPDTGLANLLNITNSHVEITRQLSTLLNRAKPYDPLDFDAITICPSYEEAFKLNDGKLHELPGDAFKYEAQDIVLNNFDFSSRAQQKEGPTDELLWLKPNVRVMLLNSGKGVMQMGSVVGFKQVDEIEMDSFAKEAAKGYKAIEKHVRDWLVKHPQLPIVKFDDGVVKVVACHVWIIHSNGRAVAWRIQAPLRLSYAICLYKAQSLKFKSILISGQYEWQPNQIYNSLMLAHTFDSIHVDGITEQHLTFDDRMIDFNGSLIPNQVCKGILTNRIIEPDLPVNIFGKRNSIVSTMNSGKKRRASKVSLSGYSPSPDEDKTRLLANQDPNFVRYQQLSQRRHSYQPLTSYQEQQYAFVQSQNNPTFQMPLLNSSLSSNLMVPNPINPITQSPTYRPIKTEPLSLSISPNLQHHTGPKSAGPLQQSYQYPPQMTPFLDASYRDMPSDDILQTMSPAGDPNRPLWSTPQWTP